MRFLIFILFGVLALSYVVPHALEPGGSLKYTKIESAEINEQGSTIQSRFNPPEGFVRENHNDGSFTAYLRQLPLKPSGQKVKYYDGRLKASSGIYVAVVNHSIGSKDLHQCADAVIRIRADYLLSRREIDRIHFNFTNGFNCSYSKWVEGYRVHFKDSKAYWVKSADRDLADHSYWKYLEMVFSYAGTISLSKELKPVRIEDMQPGDVFIQGGSPGHAVIVLDIVVNPETGKRMFLLGQSYMPAQETQVLLNPVSNNKSAWYSLDFGGVLETPEWTFSRADLKRFAN